MHLATCCPRILSWLHDVERAQRWGRASRLWPRAGTEQDDSLRPTRPEAAWEQEVRESQREGSSARAARIAVSRSLRPT